MSNFGIDFEGVVGYTDYAKKERRKIMANIDEEAYYEEVYPTSKQSEVEAKRATQKEVAYAPVFEKKQPKGDVAKKMIISRKRRDNANYQKAQDQALIDEEIREQNEETSNVEDAETKRVHSAVRFFGRR